MDKKTIFKAAEVEGETKYNYDEIIEISKNTIIVNALNKCVHYNTADQAPMGNGCLVCTFLIVFFSQYINIAI